MAQNEAPAVSSFCAETSVPEELPVIRFIGGIALEPQIDPTRGTPGSCGLTLDLLGNVQSALAPFQPFLTLLDLVATLAQCFLLLTEVVSNPFKIPDLLACIPGLVSKVNALLSLIPVFPQGIQAFITFIVDVIRFVATQIDCVVSILESIQAQLDELARIAQKINSTDDTSIVDGLRELFDCGTAEAQQQIGLSLSALGPIARILCTIRALIALIPGGNEVQKQIAFPDPTGITDVTDAISALQTVRDVLLGIVDALVALTAGLGVLPAPEPGFVCPLDSAEEEEEPEPATTPTIDGFLDTSGFPLSSVPVAPGGAGAAFKIVILGSGYDENSQVFWETAQIPAANIELFDSTRLTVSIPAGLRANDGTFQISVVNAPAGGASAFSGLAEPGETADTGVEVSNLEPLDVV